MLRTSPIFLCERALSDYAGQWPEDFWESELDEQDLDLLAQAVGEMEQAIVNKRKSRSAVDL